MRRYMEYAVLILCLTVLFMSLAVATGEKSEAPGAGGYGTTPASGGFVNAPHGMTAVDKINAKEGWSVGQNGVIIHTNDGGETWEREGSGTDRDLYDMVYVEGNGLIAVGAGSITLRRKIDGINLTTAANMK